MKEITEFKKRIKVVISISVGSNKECMRAHKSAKLCYHVPISSHHTAGTTFNLLILHVLMCIVWLYATLHTNAEIMLNVYLLINVTDDLSLF